MSRPRLKYDRMEAEGYDLVLIDTRPGANADTEDLILATDLVLIRPGQSDYSIAERTLEWFEDILKTVTPDSPTPALRTVLTEVPAKMISVLTGDLDIASLTPRDRAALQAVMDMPHAQPNAAEHAKASSRIAEATARYAGHATPRPQEPRPTSHLTWHRRARRPPRAQSGRSQRGGSGHGSAARWWTAPARWRP
ncbi:MAG: hypothetical protein HWE37_10875 [Rhodobacteraceae bacterium]|nr:hypothetical protein [Paracoccaceae bacterium]